jgi:hypothetical protein
VGVGGRGAGTIVAPIWSSEATGVTTTSTKTVQINNCAYVSVIGHANNATTIYAMVSADGTNWYQGPSQTLGSAGDFVISFTTGAGWIALSSSSNVTASAVVTAKDS